MKVFRRAQKGAIYFCYVPCFDAEGAPLLGRDGRRRYRQVSLRTTNFDAAKKRARLLASGRSSEAVFESNVEPIAQVAVIEGPLLADLREDYSQACQQGDEVRRALAITTWQTTKLDLKLFFDWLAARSVRGLGEVTPEVVRDYLNARLWTMKGGKRVRLDTDRTWNRRRASVSGFFTWARRKRFWKGENPVGATTAQKPERYTGEPRYFSTDQVQAIRAAIAAERVADPDAHVLETAFLIGLRTGARLKEVVVMRKEHFRWETKRLVAPMPKCEGRRREVEIHPELEQRYRASWEGTTGFVIERLARWQALEDIDLCNRISQWFRRVLKRASLLQRGLTFAALRTTFISDSLRAGVPIEVVSKWVGHESIEMTYKRYHFLRPRDGEAKSYFIAS